MPVTTEEVSIFETYPQALRRKLKNREKERLEELPPNIRGVSAAAVINDLKIWQVGTLTVSFKGGTTSLHQKIATTASQWSGFGNIRFDFGFNPTKNEYRLWKPGDTSDIRIYFSFAGYWSLVGTDCHDETLVKPGEATMNFQHFDRKLPSDWADTVLHEFGHALGFEHEHQSPAANCDFDWDKLYATLKEPPNEWSKETVDFNLRPLPPKNLTFTPPDRRSIMHYALDEWMFISGKKSPCFIERNRGLSNGDKDMAAKAYPFLKNDIAKKRAQSKELIDTIVSALDTGSKLYSFYKRYRNFLKDSGYYKKVSAELEVSPVELEVKRAILEAAGLSGTDPEKLGENATLSDLLPTEAAYQFLSEELTNLVKGYKPTAKVTTTELKALKTVWDCILLVDKKIKR